MERETHGTALHTGYSVPGSPDWDWLRQGIALAPDMRSLYPLDLGHWCHYPYRGDVTFGPSLARNEYGPGIFVANPPTTANAAALFFAAAEPVQVGNELWHNVFWDWTIAFGVARQHYMAQFCKVFSIFQGQFNNRWMRISGAGNIIWDEQQPARQLQTGTGAIDAGGFGPSQTIVVTTASGTRLQGGSAGPPATKIYVNGAERAYAAWGTQLWNWNLIYVGTDYNTKANASYSGVYGPVILSRIAWTAEQVAQWHADPWGWRKQGWVSGGARPSWLEGDVGTRAAIDGDVETRAAVEGDVQGRAAIEGTIESRAAVEGGMSSRASIEGAIASRPAIEGDYASRPTVEGAIASRAAVEGDTQTRPAVEGDTATRPAIEGDTKTRAAIEGDAATGED